MKRQLNVFSKYRLTLEILYFYTFFFKTNHTNKQHNGASMMV